MRTEDGCIIHRCLNGEPGAFGLLVDKYKAGIYAYVYTRLLHFQDAQDVTQEVFLQAYRDLRTLRRWESFVFWLYRIAHNCCAKCLQTRSRRPDQDFIEDQDPEVIDAPSLNSYRDNQVNGSLRGAIYSLPETYRQVVMLYYFGGMNTGEIAKALGTSPTTIRKRLSRARSQLKEEMVAMIGTGFGGQRLQASFTFRVVEAVRRIKVRPMPRMAGLPWGLSLAAGIIITVLSLNPHLNLSDPTIASMSSALPGESKMLKTGEISAEIVKISRIPAIANKGEDGRDGTLKPSEQQKQFHLAPAAQGDTWEKKADMPTARTEFSISSANGKIYVFGGLSAAGQTISTVEEYNPATDTWTKKASMPTARRQLSASMVNEKIYAIGGKKELRGAPFSTVEEYDPATDTWTKKADMPTARSCYTSAVNGKIYAIGGYDGNSALSIVEEYDPGYVSVEDKGKLPTTWGETKSR